MFRMRFVTKWAVLCKKRLSGAEAKKGSFGCGDIRRNEFRLKSGEIREGPKPASQNLAWGGALPCPMTPLGAHGHMPHATCGNAWANRGQPMGHGYDIRVIVVHCDRYHNS